MFGLLKQIRDKSDSDIGEVDRRIKNELNQITDFERSLNTRRTVRAQRELELTTDSDGEGTRYQQQLLREQQLQQQQQQQQFRQQRTNKRLQSKQSTINPYSKPDIMQEEQNRHYMSKLPVYSDEEKEKEHKNRDQLVPTEDLRPLFPFSILSSDVKYRTGLGDVVKQQNKDGKFEKEFKQIQTQNKSIEIITLPAANQTSLIPTEHGNNNNIIAGNKKNCKGTKDKDSFGITPMRLKMAIFKTRLRTDKALYQHFSKRIVNHRRKIMAQHVEEKRIALEQQLAAFYQHRDELIQQLDQAPISVLNNQQQEDVGNKIDQDNDPERGNDQNNVPENSTIDDNNNNNTISATDLEDVTEEDIINVVTRIEMDSIIDKEALKQQEQCLYCTYRPLHTYSMITNTPIVFTSETGKNHWNNVPKRWQNELLKGGEFVNNVERVILATVLGLPIVPMYSSYIDTINSNNNDDQRVKGLFSIPEIQQYVTFAQKQQILIPYGYQYELETTSTTAQDEKQQQQIVVGLESTWFGIAPRQIGNNNNNTNNKSSQLNQNDQGKNCNGETTSTNEATLDAHNTTKHNVYDVNNVNTDEFISTHNGVSLFCKDQYALNTIVALATFHSCYVIVKEIIQSTNNHIDNKDKDTDDEKGTKLDQNEAKILTKKEQIKQKFQQDKDKYRYQVDIYFNTGCCLCNKVGEIDYIHSLPDTITHNNNVQTNNTQNDNITSVITNAIHNTNLDEIDLSDGDIIVGSLEDSFGIKVEQFTYCVPHLKSVYDIDMLLDAENNDD